MAAIGGAEPSVERSAADRVISAYSFGVIQPGYRHRDRSTADPAGRVEIKDWRRQSGCENIYLARPDLLREALQMFRPERIVRCDVILCPFRLRSPANLVK
jgi:hypothetical protein